MGCENPASIEQEAQKVIEWSKGNIMPPSNIDIFVTNKCNLKCKFCHLGIKKDKLSFDNELSDEEILRMVKEGLELGIKKWYLEGGEPVYYSSRFLKIIRLIKKYNTYGNVNSNGTLFNEEIIREVIKTGWDEVTFSLDSHDSKIHDYIRGVPGTFSKAITNIKIFNRTKRQMKKEKPLVTLHSVITNLNYNSLDKIIKLAISLNIKDVTFTHLFFNGVTEYYTKFKLRKEHILDFEKSASLGYKLALRYGITTNLNQYITSLVASDLEKMDVLIKKKAEKEKKVLAIPCFEPWYRMIVLEDGKAGYCSFCCKYYDSENIRLKKLKDIWGGEKFQKVRKDMIKGKLPKECSMCPSSLVIRNEELRDYLKGKINNKNG
jgi:MoaA/NifB/PqqE/SkfB family radical SAM enzyme